MTTGNDPYFFGYGSLVNRATHAYPNAARAQDLDAEPTYQRVCIAGMAAE